MSLEWTQNITYPLIDIFSLITVVIAILVLIQIYKKKEFKGVRNVFLISFSFLSIGYCLYAIAEWMWSIIFFMGENPMLGIPDYLWIFGMLFVFAGFFYFVIFMCKEEKKAKKCLNHLIISSLVCGVILAYLIGTLIIGQQHGESGFEIFLDYFYPIFSAIIFITALLTYNFFKDLEDFGKGIMYLVLSVFFTFFGDLLYVYYSWNDIYGLIGLLVGYNNWIDCFIFD